MRLNEKTKGCVRNCYQSEEPHVMETLKARFSFLKCYLLSADSLPTKFKAKRRRGCLNLEGERIAMKMGNFRPKVYAILRLLEHNCKTVTDIDKYNEIFEIPLYDDEQVIVTIDFRFGQLTLLLSVVTVNLRAGQELPRVKTGRSVDGTEEGPRITRN